MTAGKTCSRTKAAAGDRKVGTTFSTTLGAEDSPGEGFRVEAVGNASTSNSVRCRSPKVKAYKTTCMPSPRHGRKATLFDLCVEKLKGRTGELKNVIGDLRRNDVLFTKHRTRREKNRVPGQQK